MPTGLNLAAAVMVPQTVLTATRLLVVGVRFSVWPAPPAARDTLAGLIDNALTGLKTASGFLTAFFAVTPYESARIAFRTTFVNDMPSRDRVWRRDLVYTVEYPTTLIEQDPIMLFGAVVTGAGNPAVVLDLSGAAQPAALIQTTADNAGVWVDGAGNLMGVPP
jgi:hypothetical protein